MRRGNSTGAKRTLSTSRLMPKRNVLILTSLLGSLTLISILLLALAPAPLVPDVPSLVATSDRDESLDSIFDTAVRIPNSHWQYIYVHHSRTRRGSALTMGGDNGMGDHFLIGNGDGCGDGEIQIGPRWNRQLSANPVGAKVKNNCICICLVGDFDQTSPTTTQLRRLEQLVKTLQGQFQIPGKAVLAYDQPNDPAGIGRQFPIAHFAKQLLP
jgi:hypothetical protein